MKKITFYFASIIIVLLSLMSCSASTDEPLPSTSDATVNNGPLKLFVLDTARVKTISVTGTNETTILNSSSYIYGFSVNSNGTKFGYRHFRSVRIANSDGSGDLLLYTAPASTASTSVNIPLLKFGASKIYFITKTQTSVGGTFSNTLKLNSINADGSGLVSENFPGTEFYGGDLTNDGKFFGTVERTSAGNVVRIVDRAGDNGAGSLYYSENLTTNDNLNLTFSYDNKFAYYAFLENQLMKVKIINMATKTSEIKTVATGVTMPAFFSVIWLSVASDNNRGVVVLNRRNGMPTKSYVFDLSAGTSTTFNNNDAFIENTYAF